MVHIMCTTLVVHLLVISVTVALTRRKCKQSLYVNIFYHFTKVGFIVKAIKHLKRDSTNTVTSISISVYNNFSKERKSEIGRRTTFKPFCRL